MKKVGIVSELSLNTVNYGNVLQAYALNRYLNESFSQIDFYSLCDVNYISIREPLTIYYKAKEIIAKVIHRNFLYTPVKPRKKIFTKFVKENIRVDVARHSWKSIKRSKFDAIIVGSDVVWSQKKGIVDRIKFLDFENNSVVKISYAASFGNNIIPDENIQKLTDYLKSFDKISVREPSAKLLLERIGIADAEHCIDPTLLLTADDWLKIEKKPEINSEKYIFVYYLGKDEYERNVAQQIAKSLNLPIVTVPFANGERNTTDTNFGDIQMINCSPYEWIWLVHHASYVITDSFHGIVFSSIFEKKFFAIKRSGNNNVRLDDYMSLIQQQDKMLAQKVHPQVDKYIWDYEVINRNINDNRIKGQFFLKDAIRCINHE